MKIKVVTWNINRAAYTRRNLWNYMRTMDFDVGFFQEVYMIPAEIRRMYHTVRGEMNAVLLSRETFDGAIRNYITTDSGNECVDDFYVSCTTEISGVELTLFSIYNYVGPGVADFAVFLDALYKYIECCPNHVIIGGDFNMSENFTNLREWGILAAEMVERLAGLGFRDPLLERSDSFTFITPDRKRRYRIDYLFIPEEFNVLGAGSPDEDEILRAKPRLSDHLPVEVTVEI
ncbi:endonuclease/exonuclease/phosphatase family protein [Methanothermobacter sp. K4]|uniref:endonuclease/exonuclease/phosphatase family protein n=1 Tax=Methanothermobacter sp. K4 TaxID=2913262 RepID=UPI001EDA3893|nr:endonuclease/exonuclease/phosphatase family protein [Methanothermobacter sp. K4]MCG2828889.1 endonuclease/exonuclease/phosphatase family protein [Methanothermobacter sp. K4]